jgi:hypothetical protein
MSKFLSFNDFSSNSSFAVGSLVDNIQGDRCLVLPGIVLLEVTPRDLEKVWCRQIWYFHTALHPGGNADRTVLQFDSSFQYDARFKELMGKVSEHSYGQNPDAITGPERVELAELTASMIQSRDAELEAGKKEKARQTSAKASASRTKTQRQADAVVAAQNAVGFANGVSNDEELNRMSAAVAAARRLEEELALLPEQEFLDFD